jgi:hypothetical protein
MYFYIPDAETERKKKREEDEWRGEEHWETMSPAQTCNDDGAQIPSAK